VKKPQREIAVTESERRLSQFRHAGGTVPVNQVASMADCQNGSLRRRLTYPASGYRRALIKTAAML
jgi:hypothetical protein